MTLKLAVIGGGSTYTPELVEGLTEFQDRLPIDEIVLCDIDPARLEVVAPFARRILRRLGWGGSLKATTSSLEAVEGADFVLLQLRVGGQAARLRDETLPLPLGCIGQETTGPGGFAKALRTVPVVLDLADQVAQHASPDAWIVNFTNPVGIVTQALLDGGYRAIGLCNVAIGLQRRFAELLEVPAASVQLGHVGLNHLTWERAVLVDGQDRLPELIEQHAEALEEKARLPRRIFEDLGAIPSSYLRYYYQTDRVLAEQRGGDIRAEKVQRIERELLQMYRDPSLAEKPRELMQRGGAYYSTAAVQLLASLNDGRGDIQVVDVRNDGAIPGVAHDAVVEVPARIDRDGAHPMPVAELSYELAGLVHHVKAYERLAATAARTGDRRTARLALLSNPLVGDLQRAEALLERILEANESELPAFATP